MHVECYKYNKKIIHKITLVSTHGHGSSCWLLCVGTSVNFWLGHLYIHANAIGGICKGVGGSEKLILL